MLSNERFISKAPEAKIAEEKEKLARYTQMMEQVKERLAQLADGYKDEKTGNNNL